MNFFYLSKRASILLCLSFCTLGLTSFSQNQPPAATTNQLSSDRFLVILDISAGMEKRATNALRVVSQLFSSGMNGQLRRGDTIGMWTFDSELHTGVFPLHRWAPQSAREFTTSIVQFVQKQRYGKQSRWEPVMAQLKTVVADSDRITVLLISDGSVLPSGTPFDAQISDALKLNADEQKRQAMPHVTIWRAVKGEFVGFKVNTPPWPIEFPAFPLEPTNAPPTHIASAPPVTPIISTDPTPTSADTNLPPPAITNPPVVVESKPAPTETPTHPPPAVVTTSPLPTTNVTVARTVPSTETPKANAPATALPVNNKTSSLPVLHIAIGAVALVGLAIVCLAFLRRARPAPRVSLITRSMNKDRK